MEPSLLREHFYTIPFLLIKSYFTYGRRLDEMMQFISYIVKSCGGVSVGTYVGSNLYFYSHIARNVFELKKALL